MAISSRTGSVIFIFVVVVVVNGYQNMPNLQMDQPVRVQPGPSLLQNRNHDNRVKDYTARALEILTIRARAKKRRFRSRGRSRQTETCTDAYQRISATHTMCLEDIGKEIRLVPTVKEAIVQQHNRYRSRVSPAASNMQKLVWDDSLAETAGKWARQCRRGHDKSANRASPDLPGVHVGQNAAYGYRNWQTAIEAWHDEVSDFQFGNGSLGGVVGHYTQIVVWRSARVGCGQADCPQSPYKRHYVCNYAEGQMNDDPKVPYIRGESCAYCIDQCDESGNLCDCGGKLCLNGGKINLNTCECSCPGIYSGDVCKTLQCPAEDPWYCGSQWPKDYCQQFTNVPSECPYMCDVCSQGSEVTPEPEKCRLQCKNGGKVDETRCQCVCLEGFDGRRCQRKAPVCGGKTCVNGGQLDTDTCLCACSIGHTGLRCETTIQACGGLMCQNRGRLDTSSCQCKCPDGFTGGECETPAEICSGLVCENGGRVDSDTCTCSCREEFTGKRCQKEKCSGVECHNGGTLFYSNCSCQCQAGFEGKDCQQTVSVYSADIVCQKSCENGGLLDPVYCLCWCPAPYTGELCEKVDCPEEDKEVCTNLPESYCPDYFLMRHMCPYKCGLCAEKECDPDKWFCNDNYIKPNLCRVVEEYCPRFCGIC